jgi:NAD(P)-dependent dehydrogenase (short-subunit alcohol dehydrogenase family)
MSEGRAESRGANTSFSERHSRRLENKVAVITGAGRGIGLAGAIAFAREGARVVLADVDSELGARAEAMVRRWDGEATFVKTDCGDSAEVQALMARTKEIYGALHVLYNNASVFVTDDGPVTQLRESTWERVLRTNLDSVFLCTKYGIPLIVASGGGSVINTASSAAVIGIPGCDAYTASKGATVALTRSLAVEFGTQGVRVNCICPSGVETEMLRQSNLENPAFDAQAFFAMAPLGRFGTPEEIASLAVFLASDESSYLHGAIIRADGGITIRPFF